MRYFYIYKITNKLNNKFYIGAHSCDTLNNSYMGSGVRIKRAIKKYGKDNFYKEILMLCESEESLYKNEAIIIDQYLGNSLCYNLSKGGKGSWYYINTSGLYNSGSHMLDENIKNRVISKMKETKSKNPEKYKKISIENLQKAIKSNTGKKRSEETKKKQSDARKKFIEKMTDSELQEWKIKCRKSMSYKYRITDVSGNTFDVQFLQEFCKQHGLPYTTLCMAKGRDIKSGKCAGWKCIRIEE